MDLTEFHTQSIKLEATHLTVSPLLTTEAVYGFAKHQTSVSNTAMDSMPDDAGEEDRKYA